MSVGANWSPVKLAASMRPSSSADTLTGCTPPIVLGAEVRRGGRELHQFAPFRDLLADRDVEGLADSVRRGTERVFHLHRFEDQQRLAARDARAGLDQQGHD